MSGIGGTASAGRNGAMATSMGRFTRPGCQECQQGCCPCCKNWCHVCGVRKCRVRREGKWAEGTLGTTYTREFPPKEVPYERRRLRDPLLDSAPFNATTTNRADYTPKSGRAQQRRPGENPLLNLPFDGTTTYTAEFPPKRADLMANAKKQDPDWSAPFVGQTTYNAEFIPRSVRPWTAAGKEGVLTLPFDGSTEYRDQYPKKGLQPRSPRTPEPLLPSNHVDTITTYGHDYVPLPFPSKCIDCCDDPRHAPDFAPEECCKGCGTGSRPGTGTVRAKGSWGTGAATGTGTRAGMGGVGGMGTGRLGTAMRSRR